VEAPRGAYIRKGDLTEGFLRYDFRGPIFGGPYTWRGLFSEFFTVCRGKLQLLWFNFILGLNFIFHFFKLIIIHYHTPKQREIKFKPRTKLKHNTTVLCGLLPHGGYLAQLPSTQRVFHRLFLATFVFCLLFSTPEGCVITLLLLFWLTTLLPN